MNLKRLIPFALLCAISSLAQTKTPLVQPHWTFVDNSGAACAGCSLYTYLAGTTTPTPTYTDSTGVSQNTNPIILDTSGSAQIWVGTPTIKLVLKDASGNLLWTADNIQPGGSGSGSVCGPASTIQIANSTVTGFTCDSLITIDTTTHTINVGGALPATHFSLQNLGTITSSWTFDVTSPSTAALSLGGGTHAAGQYIDGATGNWTNLPSPGPGTVTSVGATVPAQMTISGSPVTSSGNLAFGLNTTGSETKVATAAAAGTSGNCVQWDASGGVGDAGNPCALALPFTGSAGYQKLTSGLILEFGTADSGTSSATITFPLAFPHALFSVAFGTGNYNINASRNLCYIAPAPSTTGMTVNTDASTVHCFWMAVGW